MKKKEKNPLYQWYNLEIPRGLREEYREKIEVACLINRYTFDNWLQGRCKIPALAKPIIESIAEKKLFNN